MNSDNQNNKDYKVDNSAANINRLLDNQDIKSKIGENLVSHNTPVLQEISDTPTIVVQKVRNKATPLFLIIIVLLFGACYYMYNQTKETKAYYEKEYSPINTKEKVTLDNDSFLVQSLYNSVKTSIEEDVGNPDFDNNLKLYLAYRNISHNNIYSSNCNMFDNSSMQIFSCDSNDNDFTPTAFHEEALKLSINKLFGESNYIQLGNIQLGNTCVVGYQYISDRGEFVSGKCNSQIPMVYSVKKTIVKATSTEDRIVIEEKVKYSNPTGGSIPEKLKSGIYHHKFRLDKNYNYIYEDRVLVEERG